jgi:protein-disulfide isomerase
VHESALAVLKLSPEKFWPYSDALFKDQKAYFDANVVNETRNETYNKLSLLGKSVGVDGVKMYDLLKIGEKAKDGSLNVGNAVTDDLKVLIKAARLVGVHVSPTVIFNGVVENSISSGWGAKEWEEWLEKNIV